MEQAYSTLIKKSKIDHVSEAMSLAEAVITIELNKYTF